MNEPAGRRGRGVGGSAGFVAPPRRRASPPPRRARAAGAAPGGAPTRATHPPPVQSPSGVVCHRPVSGSAQWGKPSVTRAAVSCTRPSIRSIASLHSLTLIRPPPAPPLLPPAALLPLDRGAPARQEHRDEAG